MANYRLKNINTGGQHRLLWTALY